MQEVRRGYLAVITKQHRWLGCLGAIGDEYPNHKGLWNMKVPKVGTIMIHESNIQIVTMDQLKSGQVRFRTTEEATSEWNRRIQDIYKEQPYGLTTK